MHKSLYISLWGTKNELSKRLAHMNLKMKMIENKVGTIRVDFEWHFCWSGRTCRFQKQVVSVPKSLLCCCRVGGRPQTTKWDTSYEYELGEVFKSRFIELLKIQIKKKKLILGLVKLPHCLNNFVEMLYLIRRFLKKVGIK